MNEWMNEWMDNTILAVVQDFRNQALMKVSRYNNLTISFQLKYSSKITGRDHWENFFT